MENAKTLGLRGLLQKFGVGPRSEPAQPSGSAGPEDHGWTRAILNSSYDAFIAIDAAGVIIDWNPQAEKTFGWCRQDVIGKALDETIIPEKYRERHRRGMKHYLATGHGPVLNTRLEIEAVHQDGREIPIELTIYPVRKGDTMVFGSFLHDISERKRAGKLQSAQLAVTTILTEAVTLDIAALRLLEEVCLNLDWLAGEFWIVDTVSMTLKCNHIWTTSDRDLQPFADRSNSMSLQRGEGLPGRVWASREAASVEDVTKDENFPRAKEALLGQLQGAVAFPIKIEDRMIGVMGFYIAPTHTLDKQVIALMSDIGQRVGHFVLRKQAERNLAEMNQELERRVEERTQALETLNEQLRSANRLKDEFLATVSHELRTPLNVIQGFSDLLMSSSLSEEDRESAAAIHRNAQAQGHIISDLLDVSRIISGKLQLEITQVDLAHVITAAFESVRTAAAIKNITIDFKLGSKIKTTGGDFNRLQQVVWNLLTNAVKFTPAHGVVTVELSNVENKLQIAVTDNGIGIEPRFLAHVFDRFRQEDATTTRTFGGLGLGLSIASHIVEAHGGDIQVFSKGKGKGTSFVVTLPTVRAEFAKPGPAVDDVSSPGKKLLSGIRVLLIDDQTDALDMLSLVIRRAGAEAMVADSSARALELLQSQRPDIIVSDIGMPNEDGYAFLKKFRAFEAGQEGAGARPRPTPVIALTAYAYEADRHKALAAGFQLHLAKPVEPAALIAAVARLVGRV